MGDEHLSTILKTESDEVIKSSVEDLVPIPSESEGILDIICGVPFSDKDHFDVESDLIESLLTRDTSIVYSPKIDSLLEDVAMEAILGEPHVHVPNELPTHPTLYQDSDFSSSDDSLGFGPEVSFPSETRNKIFDPGIFIEVQFERLLSREEFSISFINDPLYPVFDTLLPFSYENKDKVFKLGILSYLFVSHRDKTTFDFSENPMMTYEGDIPLLDVSYLHFYPP
nr:hypothetical protein [Tanacetum cinerariifolium]